MNRKKSQYFKSLQRLEDISSSHITKLNNKMKHIKINTAIIFSATSIATIMLLQSIATIALVAGISINTLSIMIAKKQEKNINIQKNALEKFQEFINLEKIIDQEKVSGRSILENYKLANKYSYDLYTEILIENNDRLLETIEKYTNKCNHDLITIEKIKNEKNKEISHQQNNNLEFNRRNNSLENNNQFDRINTNTDNRQYVKILKKLY